MTKVVLKAPPKKENPKKRTCNKKTSKTEKTSTSNLNNIRKYCKKETTQCSNITSELRIIAPKLGILPDVIFMNREIIQLNNQKI